jgi:hypothetical protein
MHKGERGHSAPEVSLSKLCGDCLEYNTIKVKTQPIPLDLAKKPTESAPPEFEELFITVHLVSSPLFIRLKSRFKSLL